MYRSLVPGRCFSAILAIAAASSAEAMTATLTSPQLDSAVVGNVMTFTGAVSDAGTIRYRFRVRRAGGEFQMIRDFGPIATLDWVADGDGPYEIEATIRNLDNGDISTATQGFQVASRVADGRPSVNGTDHPLVFVFSAPACEAGGRMRVRFRTAASSAEPREDDGARIQYTPYKDCMPGSSMNFYLAGLYASTAYSAQAELDKGGKMARSRAIRFETGDTGFIPWSQTPVQMAAPGTSQPILLGTSAGSQVATDLSGRVLWFNQSPQTYVTRIEAGGYLWGFLEDGNLPVEQQAIRKVDLLGRTVLETNAERVNEQLAALGKRAISGFHHEVLTLPDGRIAALASVEEIVTDVQGPGAVDVIGDMIIVFDRDLQVVWTWDTFDNLDLRRMAVGDEICSVKTGGCPPFYLAAQANDWTHGNSISLTPDGSFLYSARHQDWLIKINYANGDGDGHVIWRLGKDGDFRMLSTDPSPWFSHQHDGNFVSATRLTVFDNGNTRILNAGRGNSRGQVLELDEENRTASLVLNADLGVSSAAVGSAQMLLSGNYHFDAGFVPGPVGLISYAFEVDASGHILSSIMATTLLYRSFRLTSMYDPN